MTTVVIVVSIVSLISLLASKASSVIYTRNNMVVSCKL